MKKIFTAFVVAFIAALTINAQTETRGCAANDVLQQQLQADPALKQRMEAIEQQTAEFAARPHLQTRAVVTIPVVVHVVYGTAAQNISDAQVLSQIDVINADFRKLNSDISKVPAAFAALAADAEFQFCLAKQDPNGAATTGIVRYAKTAPSSTGWGTSNAVKTAVPAWNAAKYLNIWVCPIGGGILGYAQFPGGQASTDGVVIDYLYFGVTPSGAYNLGRTASHEVGHWLNLRHIWGDANCGNDQVSDTPTQQAANTGCPQFPRVTCGNGANGDMFMNYMDYTNDACMFMFTTGQKTRMQALFATGGSRAGLLSSIGCVAPSGGTSCAAPTNLLASSISTTGATVSWSAATGASNYTLNYRVVGAAAFTALTVTGTSQVITGLTAGTNYEYQVRTNCASSASAFTVVSTFSTTANPTVCSDSYETGAGNNTLANASAISVNASIQALIATKNDNDYYSFSNSTANPNIRVTLTGIAASADYDLRLYNAAGTNVKSSLNSSATSEKVVLNGGAIGKYSVRVYPYTGFSATQCYTLTVNVGSSTFVREVNGNDNEDVLTSNFKVSPNPANEFFNVEYIADTEGVATVRMMDVTGREIQRVVQNMNKENNIVQLNVRNVNNGLYLILVQQGEDVQSKKVVVNR